MIDLECPCCGSDVSVCTGDHGMASEGEDATCMACGTELQVVCDEIGECECSSELCQHSAQDYIEYEARLIETGDE